MRRRRDSFASARTIAVNIAEVNSSSIPISPFTSSTLERGSTADPIRFPISAAMGRRLCAAARPARYGLRDQTLLDKDVRDCGEIPKSRIRIDQRRWKSTLGPRLAPLRRDLGVSSGAPPKAALNQTRV